MSPFNDNEGCGCFLILAAIGFIAWIGMTASKNSSGGSSNTTPTTQTSTPYTPPPSNYTPTYSEPVFITIEQPKLIRNIRV